MIVTRNFDQNVKKEIPKTKYHDVKETSDSDIIMTIYDKIFPILLDVGPSQQSVLSPKLKTELKNLKQYSFIILFIRHLF